MISSSSNQQLDDSATVDIIVSTLRVREDLKFIQASNINVSNFVSVKLSNHNNYPLWKAQMLCLIESQMLVHIINDEHPFPQEKGVHMINQYKNLVKGWIFGSLNEQVLKRFIRINSVQEIWETLEFWFDASISDTEDSVGFMFGKDLLNDTPEIENTSIVTRERLYEAAVEGCWWKAKSILKKTNKNLAIEAITRNGNTILHLAVELGQNHFVEKLLQVLSNGNDIETKNKEGQTALHIAAIVGNEYATQLLVQKRKELLVIRDHKEELPMDCAFSNKKLNIYVYLLKSSLSVYSLSYPVERNNGDKAIVAAIYIKQYDLALTLLKTIALQGVWFHLTLFLMAISFPDDLGFTESLIYPSFYNIRRKTVMRCSMLFHPNILDKCVDDILRVGKICGISGGNWLGKIFMVLLVPIATFYPIYQLSCLLILVLRLTFSILYLLLWKVLEIIVPPIKNIEKKKKEYGKAKEVLSLICSHMGSLDVGYSEPILEAVRVGTYEVVDEILFTSPSTINCKNEEGHSIIQLAIINRSEKVYNLIHHIIERTESFRTMRDSSKNNLAHLVGRLAPSFVLDRTTGAALQLQRELLWREEVEKLLLPMELRDENLYKVTPAMVFTEEHQDLMKQGEIWMKTTAESCSITAALIVTIVFAAAITVPGGSNQESGIPILKKEIAFTIFAISNAFSLFTASTALLLFLSILTARFSENDFLVSLPRRLIFGLLTLFLSTTAMIVAFGAILFLVFCDQRPWMLAPIFVFSCMPISVIVTIKLPLLIDLIQSTYFPIFGKQSYLESCKINRKNTIFRE